MANYLTLTIIFLGSNLNYGESIGNITALKKLSFKGKSYSYISRQALRYDIVRIMNEEFKIPLTPVGSDGKVVQFDASAQIDKYPEIDLFGYMKTRSKSKKEENEDDSKSNPSDIRKAVVRLSDAVSLEPWQNDIDYGNNMGLALRSNKDNMIFQNEIHKSFYTYTLTVELDKVGKDENSNIELPKEERYRRVEMLLDTIKILYRDIKGRRENLAPIFIIGGVYQTGNPFFYNKLELIFSKDSIKIKPDTINDTLKITYFDNNNTIKDNTYLGFVNGIFDNIQEIEINKKYDIQTFFEEIKKELKKVYGL